MLARSRATVVLLALAAASTAAPRCAGGGPGPEILAPEEQVQGPAVDIEVRIPDGLSFDPASDALLNDHPVPLSGPGPVYATRLGPGFPLTLENRLEVHARGDGGESVVTERRFRWETPRALARRIEREQDRIRGPLAHGRNGDFLLENGRARFVIQGPTPVGPDGVVKRDFYAIGQYGGNLIDAELRARPGLDNFLEIQPMLNIESVLHATHVEIVHDGMDGLPAVVRACGPDDLLDFVNPSSFLAGTSFRFPPLADDRDLEIEACTEYRLAPGDAHLTLETTVFNNQPVGATPADLPLLVGDWVNAAGELEAWTAPSPGVGPGLVGGGAGIGLLSWFGYGEARGVDVAFSPVPTPGLESRPTDYFTTSGVNVVIGHTDIFSALLGAPPPFIVPRGGSRSWTRLIGVGDGSGANAVALQEQARGVPTATVSGCVTVGGVPRADARVSVVVQDAAGGAGDVVATFVTSGADCPNYAGAVPAGGPYGAAAARAGSLYEGGGPVPPLRPLSLAAGDRVDGLDFDLPPPGVVEVQVADEEDFPLVARVTVVGFDPSPARLRPGVVVPGFGSALYGLFEDPSDRLPFGVVAVGTSDADGLARFEVEPGDYRLVVSRGTEYSIFEAPLHSTSGAVASFDARLVRVVDTTGFVSSDFHVHGIRSPDSRVSDADRVRSFASEGIDNAVMTDHQAHADLAPAIRRLGLARQLHATVGEEVTTFDYGHFNAYPMALDPELPSGGSTDWARPAPPGADFPSAGALGLAPSEIFALGTGGPQARPGETTMQINHIDSYFEPLRIDTGAPGPVQDGLGLAERASLRLPSTGNLFHPFPALELWNGSGRRHQSEFLDERIGIWFNLLRKGILPTAIADTDSHTYTNLNTAGARTWTASPTGDGPWAIRSRDVAFAVGDGRAVGGQGLYVQTRLLAADGSGAEASLASGASRVVASDDGSVELEIRVQAPVWAAFDRIEVYANAATQPVDPAEPYLYRAAPGAARVLREGDCDPDTRGDGDFDVDRVPVWGEERLETTLRVPYPALVEDTWFVVVARGSDGVCPPMFPVYAQDLDAATNATLGDLLDGNVGEGGVMALGFTNPLFADVDGVPGFQGPDTP